MKPQVEWAFGTWPELTRFNPRFSAEAPKILLEVVIPNEAPYATVGVAPLFRCLSHRRPSLKRIRCGAGDRSLHLTGEQLVDLAHLFEHYLTCVLGRHLPGPRVSGVTLVPVRDGQPFRIYVECWSNQQRSLRLLALAGGEFLQTLNQLAA
ncbi:MAG: hypothetical protein HYY50_01650 [Candidatus Kerfeldbacteria bacterium]|nr:hypothetical protein [Candidatus Kerfeldbacteria bacterium]